MEVLDDCPPRYSLLWHQHTYAEATQDDHMSCHIRITTSAHGYRDQVERYYNFFIGVEV